MLYGAPQTVRYLWITQSQFERLLLVQEHFALLNLVITIDLSVSSDTWSSCALRQVSIVLKCLSLAYFTVLADDIDLNPSNVLIKNWLFLFFFGFFLFLLYRGGFITNRLLAFFFLLDWLLCLFCRCVSISSFCNSWFCLNWCLFVWVRLFGVCLTCFTSIFRKSLLWWSGAFFLLDDSDISPILLFDGL